MKKIKSKWIKGYKGYFKIYEDGRVESIKRVVITKKKITPVKQKFIVPTFTRGYAQITLRKKGILTHASIHRLVYETFVKKIPKGMQINHIDANKLNNSLSNLEPVTPLENVHHAMRLGLYPVKLNKDIVRLIRKMSAEKIPQNVIANIFNVHPTNIHYVLSGKTWSHVK